MMPTEEMIQAATKALTATGIQAPRERAIVSLNAAFAALDREALIEAAVGVTPTDGPGGFGRYSPKHRRDIAEAVLRAVRLIA